jgi:hypothetical protein
MKFLFSFALMILGCLSLTAQDTQMEPSFKPKPKEQTLFNHSKITRWGGFGAPFFSNVQIGDYRGYASGGGGGVVMNNFFLGFYGQGESYGVFRPSSSNNRELSIGHGGLWMGYVVPSHKALHLYSSLKLGGGGIAYYDIFDNNNFDFVDVESPLFLAMPEVGLEINVFRWFRLSVSAGYRLMTAFDDDLPGFSKSDLNRPFGTVTMRFGGFGHY